MSAQLENATLRWGDGTVAFGPLTLHFAPGTKTGLVGPNGAGKSTLARVLAGELRPTSGQVRADVDFFSQHATAPQAPVGEVLLEALSGSRDPVAARLAATLPTDRLCSALSGGEWARLRLAQALAGPRDFVVLDEPTNHLDLDARRLLLDWLRATPRGVVVISHDRDLLRNVERIVELTRDSVRTFGGNYDVYLEESTRQLRALERELQRTTRTAKAQKRSAQVERERSERRAASGKRKAKRKGIDKVRRRGMAERAGATQQREERARERRVGAADQRRLELESRRRWHGASQLRLPELDPGAGAPLIHARNLSYKPEGWSRPLWRDLSFRTAPGDRLRVRGPNGSGKTTLLRLLEDGALSGSLDGEMTRRGVRAARLDQSPSLEPDTPLAEALEAETGCTPREARWRLVQMGFSRERTNARGRELSGGERMRLALLAAVFRTPAPNLLLLDEPTNDVDLPTIRLLEALLREFSGAIVYVSHDPDFVQAVLPTDEVELGKHHADEGCT